MIPTRIKLTLCLVTLLERTFDQWTMLKCSAASLVLCLGSKNRKVKGQTLDTLNFKHVRLIYICQEYYIQFIDLRHFM